MDSNTHHHQQQPYSGLLRFRSAPSSLFSGNNNAGDSDSERLFSRFASYGTHNNESQSSYPLSFQEFENKSTVTEQASSPRVQGCAALPPHYPRQSSFGSSDNFSSYGLADQQRQGKNVTSNLVRQSSSPSGLFSNNNVVQNGLPFGGWSDPSSFAENLCGMRRDHDTNQKLFSATQVSQNGDLGNRVHMLSHHLSLPKNSAELALEKFLQLQDSVPCKVRAKRGCATHPRSIAERVRRTRISERMRKLQELVPNMDKQTNTADMLDLAVDYIKELQKQFKSLSDIRANCKCLSIQKPVQIR